MAFRRPCGRPFANQQALQQHFNASIHAQIYICQEHDRKFGSQQALEQHLDSPAHAPVYECVNCNRQFGSQRALDQHLDSPAHVPVYECIKCNRKFGSQQALDQHLNSSAHLLQCGEHGRPWGKKEGLESSRISPCDTKEPPTKRLVSDHWDPIHWELGYQLRDSYEISQTPQIVQDLPSHTTNTSSLKPGFTEYSGNLEPLRGKIPPLDLDTVNYSGTVISYSPKLMLVLQSFIQSRDILRKNGYIVERLSESDLDGKKRCRGCGKSMRNLDRKIKKGGSSTREEKGKSPETLESKHSGEPVLTKEGTLITGSLPSVVADAGRIVSPVLAAATSTTIPQPQIRCKYHCGIVEFKMWSCCGKKVSSDSCTGSEFHIPHQYPQGEIERLWRFFSTPIISNNSNIRLAVALDCEMGTATSGDSELIRVTLVDYFSSAILVDSLVYPDVEMSHYNTRFSGVTKRDMKIARAKGTCFRGRDEARLAVWQFVGPNTIVVGHSVNCDLTAMRWIHPIVVDTLLIESMKAKAAQEKEAKAIAEPIDPAIITDMTSNVAQEALKKGRKGPGTLSLKTLAMVRLNREIQSNGNKGHDSLEDALAARDLAHWHVMNSDYGGKDSPGIQVVNRRV